MNYQKSSYYFVIDREREYNAYYVRYSPGENLLHEFQHQLSDWDEIKDLFEIWLNYLKEEIKSVDLWDSITDEKQLLHTDLDGIGNEQFTSDELVGIDKSINEIKEFLINELNFNKIHMSSIESRLEYLIEASKRLGKKDWIVLSIGVFTNIALGFAFQPET